MELKITNPQSRSAHLTWTIGSSTKHPILKQELVYFLEENKNNKERHEFEGKKRSFKIHGLIPFSKYVVRLKVKNLYVSSDQKEISFTTAPARK
jgi:hypothetical protein